MKIDELLEQHGVAFVTGGSHRHVRSGWIGLDCPWCYEHDKYHLGINLRTNACTCWKCGKHSLTSVLVQVTRMNAHEAYVAGNAIAKQAVRLDDPYERRGTLKLPNGRNETLPAAHLNYLRGRNFDPDQIQKLWNVQGIAYDNPSYAWSLFIPVMYRGETVSWTTRKVSDEAGTRYLHSPPEHEVIPIKSLLYGIDYALGAVVVTEGPTDVWNVGPGCTCTFGLNVSSPQLKLIVKFPVRYFCFDSSADAQKRAKKLADMVSVFPGETYNIQLDAEDPGCASRKEVKLLRKTVFGL